MFCLNMMAIALELASHNPAYEDVATKFFEHFVYIGAAVNRAGDHGPGLWSEEHGFYFDLLKMPDGRSCQIDAFTIAGLIPLFAVAVGDPESFRGFRDFRERFDWFCAEPARAAGQPGRPDAPRRGPAACAWRWSIHTSCAHAGACARPGELLRPARRALGVAPACSRALHARVWKAAGSRSTTSRPKPPAPCSAATATGAGRCGFR